ncbi:hypothetical protein ACOMHN_020772 [Nucella lapillus]
MDGNKTKIINPKKGLTKIGTEQSLEIQDIVISGEEAQPDHCVIEYVEGVVTLHPIEDSSCSVNGVALTSPSKLTQGALIQLGKSSVFRFNYPEEAEKLKQIRKALPALGTSVSLTVGDVLPTHCSRAGLHTCCDLSCWDHGPQQQEGKWAWEAPKSLGDQ